MSWTIAKIRYVTVDIENAGLCKRSGALWYNKSTHYSLHCQVFHIWIWNYVQVDFLLRFINFIVLVSTVCVETL